MGTAKRRGAGKRATPKKTTAAKTPEELQSVRNKVTRVIVNASVEMAERMVQSVGAATSVAALRYLWELVGLFPVTTAEAPEEQDSLAKELMRGIGLSEDLREAYPGPVGDVKSKSSE
jgi:hypothetical protein